MAILTTPTRLANKLTLNLTGIANRFTISNLRLADIGFNVKFTTHTVNDDVQVQLTHTTNDSLAGLFVGLDTERWIFLSQLAKCHAHFFLVGLSFRLNRNMNHRLREVHPLKSNNIIEVT